jgi:hypothetical protein
MVESAPPPSFRGLHVFFFFFSCSNFEFPARIKRRGGGKTHQTPYLKRDFGGDPVGQGGQW